jgi:glycosyltransferase involved in cell wall biosynthesis
LFKSDFHGRIAARIAGVPVVVSTLHNNDVWANNWILGHIYGATARYADKLIAVSPEVKDFHIHKTGVSPEKISVIVNAVDVPSFSGHEKDAAAIRKEFGISEDAPLFGIVGRLKPQKDLPTFLMSAVEILREYPKARFLVVGDGPLFDELKKQAESLGLFPALVFTGMRKDIPAILSALDVLVLSSLWEGLPVILLEAMAAGLPVVSTSVDGVMGVVLPDETAFLVPTANPSALAQACLKFARDPQLRERMGKAGLDRVTSNYSLSAMINRISGLYIELLKAKGLTIPENIQKMAGS